MKDTVVSKVRPFRPTSATVWLALIVFVNCLLAATCGAQSQICGNQASQEIRAAATNLFKFGFDEFSDSLNDPKTFTNSVPPKRYTKKTLQGNMTLANTYRQTGSWSWAGYGGESYLYNSSDSHTGSRNFVTTCNKFTGEESTLYQGTASMQYDLSAYYWWNYHGVQAFYPFSESYSWSGVPDTSGNWVVTSKSPSVIWDPGLWYPEPGWPASTVITIAPTSISHSVDSIYQDGNGQAYGWEGHSYYWTNSWSTTIAGSQTESLSEEHTTDQLVANTVTGAQGEPYPVDQDNQPLWSGGSGRAYNLVSADELNAWAGKTQFRFSFESETNMGYWIAYELITNVYDHGILITGYSGLNIETAVIPGNGSNVYSQEYSLDVPPLGYEIIVGTCYIIPTNQPCVIFQPNPLFLCLSNVGLMTAWVFPPQAVSSVTYELQEDVPGVAQISAAGTNITVVGTAPGWATVLAKIGTNVIGAGAVAVANVVFPTNTISVSLNGTWTFDVLVEPGSVPITFESSDTNVATVTTGGGGFTMTGLSLGNLQIIARIGTNSVCATAPAMVVDYTNATLVADRYLCEGGKGSVWVDLIPADALPAFTLTITNVTTTNGLIADITGGNYPLYESSGLNFGDARIEARVGGSLIKAANLTVVRIEFPVNTNGVIGIGLGNYALNTTMLPREAPVTYYSVNTNIVLASGSGRHLDLFGLTNGVAEVRAKLGTNDLCSSVGVTVTNPGVSVNLSFFPYLCEGASTPVSYTANPPGAVTLDTSDHNIAVMSGTNVVGVSYGETMVLALQNGIIVGSKRVTVVHVDFPASETSIRVDPLKPTKVHPTVLPESAADVVAYMSEDALIAVAIGSGTNLDLFGVSDGRTTIRAQIGTNQLCSTMKVIATGCSSCDSGKCDTFGSLLAGLSSVNVSISLGGLNSGKPSGFIRLRENNPGTNVTSPAGLYVAAPPEIQAYYANGQLTQVRAPQGLVNVRVINSTTFALDCYLKPVLTGAGPHATGGLQLQNTITFTGSANSQEVTVTDTRSGQVQSSYTFTWLPSNANWRLTTGYKQEEIATSIFGPNRTDTRSTYTYTNGVTPTLVAKARRSYFQFAWGWALTQEVLDPDGAQVKTTYDYDGQGRLLQVTRPDGSWEGYAYHPDGSLARVLSPFGLSGPTPYNLYAKTVDYDYTPLSNSGDDGSVEPDRPRRIIESVYGKETGRSYAVFLPGEEREIRCATIGAAWNNTNNLVTVTKRHTSGDFEGEIISIRRPDGVMELRDYEITAQTNRVTTISVGQPDNGATAVTNGTTTITVTGPEGQLLSVTNRDIATSVVLGTEIYSNHDSYDRPQRVTYLDGTYRDTIYGCCGVDSERDRDGVTTTYLYDSLKRPYTAIRAGYGTVSTITVYDGAGNVLSVRRKGADNSEIVQQRLGYDLAGRLKEETNALMGVTRHGYGVNLGQYLAFHAITNADGGYRIETFGRDGSLFEIKGNAAAPVRYEVGLEGNQVYAKEIRLTAAGNPTDEQTKTWRDALGRTVAIAYGFITNFYYYTADGQFGSYEQFGPAASFNYNQKGQLIRQTDPDGVATMFAYNGLGEQEWAGIDMDRNWVMENYQGQDRVVRTVRDVVGGASPCRRTQTYVLPNTNNSTTLMVGETRVSPDGLRQWQISFGRTNYAETTFGAGDYRTNTVTAPDGTRAISTYWRGVLLASEQQDSTGTIRLSRVDYVYDAHGRLYSATDARTGVTSFLYNAADQVISQSSLAGGTLTGTSILYDVLGRPTRFTQPDGTTVTNEYYVTGALKKTHGSRTYPVQYTYDAQGRMAAMRTWRFFAAGSGTLWADTTWNYDPRRGWLTSKRYNDNQGVDYGYSSAGRLVTRTWARGNPRARAIYSYDYAGDVNGVYYDTAPGPSAAYTRDRLGRVTRITQGTNIVNRTYNDAGQLLSETYGNGPLNGVGTVYTYDSLLRRSTVAAVSGNSQANLTALTQVTHGYGSHGALSNLYSVGVVADYGYAADSTVIRQVSLKDGSALRTVGTRAFDAAGRLTSQTWTNTQSAVLQSAGYLLNSAGQRTRVTLGDGSYWLYEYDELGQVKNGRRYRASGQAVPGQQFDYQYDAIGNRTQATTGNGRRANYLNNSLNQVENRDVPGFVNVAGTVHSNATVTINDQTPPAQRQGEYFFKELPVLNLTSAKWVGLTNLAVLKGTGTNLDKEISQTGWAYVAQTPETFAYDADGNVVSDGRWLYTWDGENRLTQMVSSGAGSSLAWRKLVFEYDWAGRRTRRLTHTWNPTLMGGSYVLSQERRYVYDGWNLVAELDEFNGPVRTFTWGPDLSGSLQGAGGVGGLLGLVKWHREASGYYGSDVKLGVMGDGNGNVTGLVDMGAGTQVAWYEYGPFGEGLRVSGPWAWANPFRFSTKFQDEETDLYYYGYRYYNASTGRWLSRDPIQEEGGVNLYGMANNDPVNEIDLFGLSSISACDKYKKELERLTKEIAAKQLNIKSILNNEIKDRMEDLALDKNELKHKGTFPGAPDRATRKGHWKLLNERKKLLAQRRAELQVILQKYAEVQCKYSACKNLEKQALEKGATSLGKRCAGFICRKSPLAIILFSCDAAQGGVCHAIKEFTWPLSDIDISGPPVGGLGSLPSYEDMDAARDKSIF